MKQFLLSAAFLLITFIGFGQCPTEFLNLTTQEDIDNFSDNYPNCTQLTSFLFIGGNDITNLDGLSQIQGSSSVIQIGASSITDLTGLHNITVIEGGLEIFNTNLQNLEGLNSLTEVGSLFLELNQDLENLVGLENLIQIDDLELESNASLENLNGIGPIETCSSLTVIGCPSFTNFSGLEDLESMNGFLRIENNQNLLNFDGLQNLESVVGYLNIRNNPNLEGFTTLESLSSVGEYIWVYNCDSVQNLDGFENIVHLDYSFRLIGNINLSDISGFSNLSGTYQFGIRILDNPNLSACNIQTVCENLYVNDIGYFEIENNGPGCNSIEEVGDSCGAVNIPDTNLLNGLLNSSPQIDTNNDNLIQYSEAGAYLELLELSNMEIANYEGLQAFPNVEGIDLSNNLLSFLNLDQNIAVRNIDFSSNPQLEAVSIKNDNIYFIVEFEGVNCPNLQFICVDDVPFAEANFTNVDPQVQFVADCEFLSVPAFNLEEAVTVFPNPVSERLTISVASSSNFIKSEIYTVSGQILKESSAKQVEMGDLSAGIYFVKVISEEGTITKKIVKQ